MKTLLNGREVVLLWSFLLMSSVIMSSATWAAPKAEILEYGFYSFTDGSERLMQPITTSGYVTKGKTQLDKNTNRIPLEIGRLFGFRFRISGMNRNVGIIPLEFVVVHPEMKKPDGTFSTGYRYNLDLKLTNGMVEDKTGYRVNEDFEMVEGEWHFEYRFMNKTLIKQSFTTFTEK
ncbi:MAG: DUF3859 domain-containing protein [Ectothiorhodospiraceae bacterium]|nr:DUF3859 domain-containing protein [Ectothiorhodospiraceae bacterium]